MVSHYDAAAEPTIWQIPDDVWAECAHHLYDVVEQRILRPVISRFVRRLRESEIVRTPEILVRAVQPSRRQQLFGSNDTERFAELVADQILSTVAARER